MTSTPCVVSHLHPDHCVDLCGLYVARGTTRAAPTPRPYRCYGPAAIAGRMARAYDLDDAGRMGARAGLPRGADRAGSTVGPFTVTPFLVNHPVEAYGVRVEARGPHAGLHR